jgi:hypothetical protein
MRDFVWMLAATELLAKGCNLDRKNPSAKEDITHLPPAQLAESMLEKVRRISWIYGQYRQTSREPRMKMTKPKSARKMNVRRPDGYAALRVWQRTGRKKQSSRLLLKCGDCDNSLEIYYDSEALEIGGVHGSVKNWREILLPLLSKQTRT